MAHDTPDKGIDAFRKFRGSCPHFHQPSLHRRPANALNVEIGQAMGRCILKKPEHWPEGATALRWIGSGGSYLVFGACNRNECSLGHEWCPECGHRKESHHLTGKHHGCLVDVSGWPCGCEHYAAKATD